VYRRKRSRTRFGERFSGFAENRYRNELLEDDECQLLLDRSKRLRSQPKLVTTS
jgi:hypothetical protein